MRVTSSPAEGLPVVLLVTTPVIGVAARATRGSVRARGRASEGCGWVTGRLRIRYRRRRYPPGNHVTEQGDTDSMSALIIKCAFVGTELSGDRCV